MKASHFVSFVTLLLLEIILCISFFYIYSGGIQKTYVEDLKDYSRGIVMKFKTERYFIEPTEESERTRLLNERLGWIQSNYRKHSNLLFHIYRDISTNDVIFSNARNEKLGNIMLAYIRQWDFSFFNKSNFTIIEIGNYNLISILSEIDDDIRPVGKIELVYDYSPVKLEIDKLRDILIWFSTGIGVMLFITFIVFTLLYNKKKKQLIREGANNKEASNYNGSLHKHHTKQMQKSEEKTKNKSPLNLDKASIRKLHKKRNMEEKKDNNDNLSNKNSINAEEELYIKKYGEYPSKTNKNEDEQNEQEDFLSTNKGKNRKYIHKINL